MISINKKKIIRENAKDVKNLKRKNVLDRLILNKKKIAGIINSIKEIKNFLILLGKTLESWKRKK